MAKISQYERDRDANIARNKALLASLNIEQIPFDEPKEVRRPKKSAASKKRKAEPVIEETTDENAPKIARTDSENDGPASRTRRSARNAGKTVDYKSEHLRSQLPAPLTGSRGGLTGNEGPLRTGSNIKKIVQFGSIPGVEVGSWWQSREDCSNDSIHAPWVAGISGGKNEGAYSIVLSGGYDDDVDLGYALYRYDGLYKIEKTWREKGLNEKGFLVCKFAFKRVEGQPPIPKRDTESKAGTEDQDSEPEADSDVEGPEEGGEELLQNQKTEPSVEKVKAEATHNAKGQPLQLPSADKLDD
ncbi:hypothetical protein HWV62_37539 [Athelia sp. TMB]|nr:hypothetical protein HWV62_37581 [Athelia sp. TMB]KAF7966650.1 hypothetical protein HWV62_37539 [Athelia sp. TMB]